MTLSDWQKDVLAHGELFLVGGVVRDALMGITETEEDVDYLVRAIEPKKLEALLSRHGRVQLVGKSFGVYKFKPDDEGREVDIAFPRREVSTGSGHRDFDVEFAANLPVEVDLKRRDFTINAMARSIKDDTVIDPFGGRRDIASRTVRMVFPEAFREDPLRILRGVRFAARFSLTIDEKTFDAMKASSNDLCTVSSERVQEEFSRIFAQCDRPSESIELLRKLKGLAVVLPELNRAYGVDQNEYHSDDVYWHSLKTCDCAPKDNLAVRWAALLHDLGKVDKKQTLTTEDGTEKVVFYGHEELGTELAEKILTRLKYGSRFAHRCTTLVRHHMFNYEHNWSRATVRRFIRTVGEEYLDDLLVLREADCLSRDLRDRVVEVGELRRRIDDELKEARAFKREDLAIDGTDVIKELGITAGKRVGEILQEILDVVLESPEKNNRDCLLEVLRKKYK